MSTEADSRRVEYMNLDEIESAHRNPKEHDAEGISRSISTFGFAELPLLDERTGRLVAGHGRINQLRAARTAGDTPPSGVRTDAKGTWLVPLIRGWSSRSDADAEAYVVASNNLTTRGGWDEAELGQLLSDLNDIDPDLFAVTGFTQEELDALLEDQEDPDEDSDDDEPSDDVPPPPKDPITKPGDIWILGDHRVICGDCRDWSTVERLLGGQRVNVAFTSPPYASQRKYDETSGFKPIPPDEYVDWFEDVQANVRAVLAESGSWFVNIKEPSAEGQRHLYVKDLVAQHVRGWGWTWVEELCWLRNALPGSPESMRRFKNGFEPVFQFATSGDWKFRPTAVMHESAKTFSYADQAAAGKTINARAQGVGGGSMSPVDYGPGLAYPTNVLDIKSGANVVGHSAAFPVALPAWFIRAYSDEGDTVFDPFMGSGTTLIAAHGEGRIGYGCEISPAYTDVICRRFEQHAGIKPVLESTGEQVSFIPDVSE